MATTASVEDAIRVVVAPSQASYFAGEPFSVSVTFTNTRSQEALAPRSASHSAISRHRRSAHSVSSVPLARPPTSPGLIPRTPTPTVSVRQVNSSTLPTRKGLVGRKQAKSPEEDSPDSTDAMRRRTLTKSLSISVAPGQFDGESVEDPKGKSPVERLKAGSLNTSPSSPRVSSPLARSNSLPISTSHPHARKQSVLDGSWQPQEMTVPPSPTSSTASINNSTSTFSLSLDTISEGTSSPLTPSTPAISSPNPNNTTALPHVRVLPPTNGTTNGNGHARPDLPRHNSHQPLGYGPPPPSQAPPTRAFSSPFAPPAAELILYAYAQLSGSVALSPLPGGVASAEQAQALGDLRARLATRRARGGGSMDITARAARREHGRAASISSTLLSLLSPTPSGPGFPAPRASSMFALLGTSGGAAGLGLGAGAGEEDSEGEAALPIFEMQPTLLAVDLTLAPGESRTFTYNITLPTELPPTHRGRVLRMSYQFMLGVCRAPTGTPSGAARPTGANSSSRVMKVPIRVYNNVAVGKAPQPYDLLWPCKPTGSQIPAKVIEEPRFAPRKLPPSPHGRPGTYEDLQAYARTLVASFSNSSDGSGGPARELPVEIEREREREETGGLAGCRQAVEILTRNPKKASYDVNKDGVKVAVLTFTKSAYRLGETVLGVVELNERTGSSRVLKLSAMLEAHESLPTSLCAPNSRQTRRVHAEHHSSFVVSTLRTTFSLDIPPDASPAFHVALGDARRAGAQGGLEWKVRLCLLVAVAAPDARASADGVRLKHLVRDGPRGEWGTSWKAAPSIAPLERPNPRTHAPQENGAAEAAAPPAGVGATSWVWSFAASLLGPSGEYHDGDDLEDRESRDAEGAEEEWRAVRTEMVECEVPMRVWPANTAFKATEVVFDV